MSTLPELSCADCPLVCAINDMKKESKALRAETWDRSIHAMGEFAVIEGSGNTCGELRARWQHTSEGVFSELDSADKTLTNMVTGLTETCDEHQPSLDDTRAEDGEAALKCNSALADYVIEALKSKTSETAT